MKKMIALIVLGFIASGSPAAPRNVLFIIADDLNDFVSPLRDYVPGLTPNMDRMAAAGVSFNNAQANGLYCAPSRVSVMTGIQPTTSGYYGHSKKGHFRDNPVLRDVMTLPQTFLKNGYATFATGKIYHGGNQGEPQYFTGDKGGRDGMGIPHDFGPWPWNGVKGAKCAHPSARPPLDRLPFGGYSRLSDIPEYAADPAKGIPGYKGWTLNQKPWRYVNPDDRDLLPDESSVQWAAEIMNRKRSKPFFLAVGFNRPHTPMVVPDNYYDLFPLDQLTLPPMPDGDMDDVPDEAHQGKMADFFKEFKKNAGEQGLKEYLQAYLASIRFVDDQLGALLNALEESPAAKNTVVLFTSDQGYHMGEKAQYGKNTCWERTAHIPLIFAGSGVEQAGAKIDAPVSLVDVYPTLLELCGLPPMPNKGRSAPALDGHSLVPFLSADPAKTWKGPAAALSATEHARTVRSERYRYILHNGGGEELYDMQDDPHELRNLAKNPEVDAIKQELRHQVETLGERTHESLN
jgi:arylsulfatase A-like enzyme